MWSWRPSAGPTQGESSHLRKTEPPRKISQQCSDVLGTEIRTLVFLRLPLNQRKAFKWDQRAALVFFDKTGLRSGNEWNAVDMKEFINESPKLSNNLHQHISFCIKMTHQRCLSKKPLSALQLQRNNKPINITYKVSCQGWGWGGVLFFCKLFMKLEISLRQMSEFCTSTRGDAPLKGGSQPLNMYYGIRDLFLWVHKFVHKSCNLYESSPNHRKRRMFIHFRRVEVSLLTTVKQRRMVG